MAATCNHSELVSTPTKTVRNAEFDNNEYELINKRIVIQGIGESRNQQQAHNKSHSIALDSATIFLREVVKSVAEERGFSLSPVAEFQLVNTQTVDQRTITFKDEKDNRIYRSYLTISIEVETPLKVLFRDVCVSNNYGWHLFLRDIDQQLNRNRND